MEKYLAACPYTVVGGEINMLLKNIQTQTKKKMSQDTSR